MRKCPHCERPTKRTEDWACQWCGYPLVSKAYKKIPKTFRQLKEERLQEQKSRLNKDTATSTEDIEITTEGFVTNPLELTVEDLYLVSKLDKAKVAGLLENKILAVTGVVANAVADHDNDIYYVVLSSSQEKVELNVNCMFDKKNSSELNLLTEGQTVTIEGKYDDYELNILIKDCVLVRSFEREETPVNLISSDAALMPAPRQESEFEATPETATEPELELASEQEMVAEPELELASEQEMVAEPEPELVPEQEPAAEVEPEPAPEPEPTLPAIGVTVDELLSAYATDEAAASERYRNKLLKVTGIINRIEIQDYLEFDYVNLVNIQNNRLEHVRCFFSKEHEPELNQLTKGQKVTVQGTFVGSIVSMHLRGCVLVSQ